MARLRVALRPNSHRPIINAVIEARRRLQLPTTLIKAQLIRVDASWPRTRARHRIVVTYERSRIVPCGSQSRPDIMFAIMYTRACVVL